MTKHVYKLGKTLRRLTPSEITKLKLCEGECSSARTRDFDWYFDPKFPVSKLDPMLDRDWFLYEREMAASDGRVNWDDNFVEWWKRASRTEEEPIVAAFDNGTDRPAVVWDGNHRVGASRLLKLTHVPVYIGMPIVDEALEEARQVVARGQ